MPKINSMVSTSPAYELASRYLHDWVMTVINQANGYGITYTNLDTWMANRYRLQLNIDSEDPIFVWLNGHGNENKLAGQDGEIVLDSANVDILSGRICHAFSCLTAVELGPLAVSHGCISYIGYADEFVFIYDSTAPNPLSDTYAKWFMDAGNQISLSLFQGKTTRQAYNDSQALMDDAIRYWTQSSDPIAPHMVACLYQDKNFQRVIGSESSTIKAVIPPPPPPEPPPETPTQFGSIILALTALWTGIYMLLGRKK